MYSYIKIVILIFFPLLMQGQVSPYQIFWDSADALNSPPITGFNGNISAGYTNRQGNQAYASFTRTTSVTIRGAGCYRATLSNGPLDGWENVKSELVWNFLPAGSPLGTVGDNTAFYRPAVGMRWFGASILIPSTNTDFNTVTSVLFNTKCVEDDWPTSTYLAMENGRFWLFYTRVNPDFSHQPTQKIDVGPVVYNQRIDWILHRNFTAADSGYINLYRNDTPVVRLTGGNWKDNGRYSKEPYMVTGLYKWAFQSWWSPVPNTNFIEAYYDDIRVFRNGATLADVSLKSKEPGAIPNQPPVAVINPSVVPTNTTSAQVIAQVTDNGTITSRAWSLQSGPNTPSFAGTQGDTLRISNLIDGEYIVRYIVTDNGGLRDTAFVTIVKSTIRTLIFSDDAEAVTKPLFGGANSNIEQFYTSRFGAANSSLVRSNEQSREGSFSYKLTLKDTTAIGATFTGNQLVWNFQPSITPVGIQWQGVSVLLPESMRGDNTPIIGPINGFRLNQEIMTHWLRIENGKWIFVHTLWSSGGTYLGERPIDLGPIQYGQWTDWAVNRNYTNLSTGFIRVYRNKELVYTYNGVNYSAVGTRPEPYFQIGMFKRAFDTSNANNKSTVTMYLDNLTFGGNAASLNEISPNQAPSVSIFQVQDTDADTVDLRALVRDIDGNITSHSWSKLSGPTSTIIGNGDTVQAVLTDTGTYVFQLIVTDDKEAVSDARVTVKKFSTYVNTPPTVTVPNYVVYKGDSSITVTAVGSDKEGPVTYKWVMENSPTNASPILSNANTATVTVTNHKPGNYNLRVIVTDQDGATNETNYTYGYRLIPAFFYIGTGRLELIFKQ